MLEKKAGPDQGMVVSQEPITLGSYVSIKNGILTMASKLIIIRLMLFKRTKTSIDS